MPTMALIRPCRTTTSGSAPARRSTSRVGRVANLRVDDGVTEVARAGPGLLRRQRELVALPVRERRGFSSLFTDKERFADLDANTTALGEYLVNRPDLYEVTATKSKGWLSTGTEYSVSFAELVIE